jgi:hypothetical protein
VNDTYKNTNQLLPLSTNLQRLIRSAVQPQPISSSGVPTPPFGIYSGGNLQSNSISSTTLTFFSNIGDTNGPAQIIACFVSSPSTFPSNPAQCSTTPTSTFVVTQTRANPNTCPVASNPNGTCTWSAGATNPTRPLIVVTGVTNGGAGVFQYAILQTSTSVTVGSGASTTTTSWPTVTSTTFNTCTANPTSTVGSVTTSSPLAKCPAAEIQKVTVDLQINNNSTTNRPAGGSEDSSVVYLLSPVSSNYSLAVG